MNSNFPLKITEGIARSCKRSVVPRSSSLTKVLESPDMLEKKIKIHNTPAKTSDDDVSAAIANNVIAMDVTTNITNAFNAYRVRISDETSFKKSAKTDFTVFL